MEINSDKWWYKQLRMVQYNLQMKDTPLMDAEKIARETSEMRADSVVINVADSVVWYDTDIKYLKVNPYLPKGRDLLAELLEQFHKLNIKVFARIAFMGFEEATYYQKPEWVKRDVNQAPVLSGSDRPGGWNNFYVPCPNGEFISEVGRDLLEEAFSKYDFDGVFYLGGVAWGNICWCDSCKKRYREIYGRPMPETAELIDPQWNKDYMRNRDIELYSAFLSAHPNKPFLQYYFPFDLDMGFDGPKLPAYNLLHVAEAGNILCTEAQNILSLGASRLHEWNTPALRMKMGRTIENYPPPVGIIHPCPGMDWRHTCMPEAEFLYWSAQIPANGGSFWTAFTGFADTIADKRMLETVRRMNYMASLIEEDMYEAESDCQVMLLSDGGVYVQGWAEALMCAHIDYDMLAHYQLSYERIKKYPMVIIPKNFQYPGDSQAIFENYVENGGKLIVEGTEEQSLRHVHKLLGINCIIVNSENQVGAYLRIEPGSKEIQEKIGKCELVPLRGRIGFCKPREESQVLATWVPPFASFSTSGFPPERASLPAERTDIPLCIVSEHGKGKVMFLPYEPAKLIREYGISDMFTMIRACAEYMLAEEQKIKAEAPQRVIMSVFHKKNQHMIHLVNGIGQRPLLEMIPCNDLNISIKLKGRTVQSVVSKISDVKLSYDVQGDVLLIHVPRLDVWDMLLISYEN